MTDQSVATISESKSLADQLRDREEQFAKALPAHLPVERFLRVVNTAVNMNPKLRSVERLSFWNACNKAALDGLLPDGREGAFVIFRSKDGNSWINKAQWMPMRAGIMKKVRNSGEISTWEQHVVHANDEFSIELGDEPHIRHRPHIGPDPGEVIGAYSVATLKSGEKSREFMSRAELEKVRASSKAADDGPWVDWFEEMCRKTVLKRHSKSLPMSTDLDDLMRRDDELYDFKGARDAARVQGRPQSLAEVASNRLRTLGDGERGERKPFAPPPIEAKDELPPTEDAQVEQPEQPEQPASTEDQVLVDQLHEQARQRAKKGKSSLTRFIGGLPKEHLPLVNRIGQELNEIAAQADAERSN
jgi:recombination protein RecT